MTNEMIILSQQIELQKQGVLRFTGNKIRALDLNTGESVEIDEIQPIHTFAAWKEKGFKVKKGEHAIAKFPIWKHTVKETEDGKEEKMFMKTAAFFSDDQVEKMERRSK